MTVELQSQDAWETANSSYLSRGLAWLRERATGGEEGEDRWWESPEFSDEDQLPPALELLGDRLGMTRFERLVLLLVAASELDPSRAGCSSALDAGRGDMRPTLALAMTMLPGPSWDVVSPQRPLRYWRLLDLDEPRSDPLTASRLRIDERILSFIKGLNVVDDRLTRVLQRVVDPLDGPLPPTHAQAVENIARALGESAPLDRAPAIELIGVDPVVRRGLAQRAAQALQLQLYELPPDRVPSAAGELDDLLRLWERETLLLPVLLYVDLGNSSLEQATRIAPVLEGVRGSILVGGREPWPLTGRRLRLVDADRPTGDEQEQLWRSVLGDAASLSPQLAAEFDFNQTTIRDVARQAQASEAGTAGVWAAARAQARPRLDTLARRVIPTATWDDLVLPDGERQLLHHIIDQVRGRSTVLRYWGLAERIKRGSGVTALFAGASGTGKTLAGEVIANELGLDMYRIDLAGVVSKYIGETERNLRRVFDAAEEGGVLLMFDEADALFGKRSEVRDSHDRYANIEVNYLLQRMEDFRGIAILATNQRHALDEAFLRRLRFIVPFPFPGPTQRAALWARAFPAQAPVEELDIERLAKLATSGGMIRNIALNAAFCAAGMGTSVAMDLVLEMARAEFRKVELPVNDADFRLEGALA